MVRTYKRKTDRTAIDEAAVEAAIQEVLANVPPHRAAVKHNINPQTLYSRIKKLKKDDQLQPTSNDEGNSVQDSVSAYSTPPAGLARKSKYATHQVFNEKQEQTFVKYILRCSKLHYGLTIIQTRKLAYEFAKNNNLPYPSSWDVNAVAGVDWMNGFRQRNPDISLRKPENTSAARSFGFNKTVIEDFFDLLASVMTKYRFPPNKIYNLDETGITTVLNSPKVLAQRSQKQVGQFVSAERGELVTFVGIINAIGMALPPVYVFPRVKFKDTFLHGAPLGSLGLSNKSGWMTHELFKNVLEHIQKHTSCSKTNPILLTLDNHESHISIEAIDYARDNGIVYLSFPPHCSHKIQPLDVSVFGPFKAKLKVAFNDWHSNNVGKALSIHNIAELSKTAFYQSFTASNITSGFSKPGLVPYNRLAFADEDFETSRATQLIEELIGPSSVPSTSIPHSSTSTPIMTTYAQNMPTSSPNTSIPEPAIEVEISHDSPMVSLESIRPLPTPMPAPQKKSNRRRGKATVFTSTPEKNRITEQHNEKIKKLKEKEEKKKAAEIRKAEKLLKNMSKNKK